MECYCKLWETIQATWPEERHPEARSRPVEVLLDCKYDKQILVSNAYKLKRTNVSVEPHPKRSEPVEKKLFPASL